MNKATLPDIGTLETYLNKVYNQCAVKFEISTDEFTLNDLTSFSHGGSGILTVYNDDQKKVLSAYDKEMNDGVYYLFFVDNVTDKKDGSGTPVSGYMPRGYNAGFIYDGGSPHTIAHELGHGVAGLEHVFENSNNSGKTANLMDYASGEELWHFQWDQIQDPSRVWMKWNKAESEGEAFGEGTNIACINDLDKLKQLQSKKYFYLPDGRIINIGDNYLPSGFYTVKDGTPDARGALSKIRIGQYDYSTIYDKKTNTVLGWGYTIKNALEDNNLSQDNNTKNNSINRTVLLVPVEELLVKESDNIQAIRVMIDGNNITIKEGDKIKEQYQTSCNCNTLKISKPKGYVIDSEGQNDEYPYVLLFDKEKNKIIYVQKLPGTKNFTEVKNDLKTILDNVNEELKKGDVTYEEFTREQFLSSDYNWFVKDVRSTMNETGKYVAVGMSLTVALPLFAEMSASLVPAYIKEKAVDFSLAFSTDFICSYVVNIFSYYLTESVKGDAFPIVMAKVFKDNWKEMLIDASMAGGQALLPAMSNTKRQVINASIYGVQALELVKIYNTISGTSTSDEDKTTFAKQAFNFAVGAGMSLLSEKISKKLSIKQFNKKPFVAVFRQTLKNMKMADDDIATFIYKTAKACDHPIFKNLSEADEIIIKGLLSNDDGAKLLDLAYRNNICNAQTIKLLSYCKSKFDVGIRNVDLRIDPKIVGHLDYIANNLDEEGCLLVNNILNISNPEKVLPDLAETLRLFEKEGIKKEWIRQYYNYIKQETIVFHYKGHAYKYNMPKTIGEVKNTFTDIKVSSKMEFVEFHAVDKNGNPCWCFYLQSKNLYFVPIKDEVSKCYKWIEVGENVLSNFIRSDYVKKLIGIK